ncbi:MAG: tetraacyldisaccharide 4'-kinase [Bacteroidales bacterium]|nr:tetraacyldisaccharide 4'-kinase [Bacteroidales bacterium]MCF8389061.1 tetraacyldisaccharide 4'-kinase [Bacteroidales bacterium]
MQLLFKILLFPFSLIYGLSVIIRNKLFDWGILPSQEYNFPIISVGNIRAGGTGKTPHVDYLIELLQKEFKVAVLSRGYGRKTKGYILSSEKSDPEEIGDEPCQLKQKYPNILIAVDTSRRRGINNLSEMNNPPDVILLDDAFQHRYVKPGLSILLFDFNHPSKKDLFLPAGRLREPYSSRKRAKILLVTKTPKKIKAIDMRIIAQEMIVNKFQHLFFTTVSASEIKPVFADIHIDSNLIKEQKPDILIVSGIANPKNIKPFARKISPKFKELIFKDHHNYTEQDAVKIVEEYKKMGAGIILTTEKDAVKLRKFRSVFSGIEERFFYLPIFINFLNEDESNFNHQIISYVRDNKRDSILHKK